MAIYTKSKYYAPIVSGTYYHLYNRAIGSDMLFFKEENYYYFLKKYDEYLSSFLETFAYCLIPNHFHLLVRIKEEKEILESKTTFHVNEGISKLTADQIVSERFRRFFITYAQAINKQEQRMGSLFMKPFKRIAIEEQKYLENALIYIHTNPQHHEIFGNFHYYKWSSYQTILNNKQSNLKIEQVIDWFGDKENFIYRHKRQVESEILSKIMIE